jgi:KipI family sensor histidine kinase inhibitor
MRVRPVGADALLLEVDDPSAWFAELSRRRVLGELIAAEIVPGADTVLLDGLVDPAAVTAAVRGWDPPPPLATEPASLVEIPVEFDGEDLDDVAGLWGTDRPGVIERLTGTAFWVAFSGFSPGWAYLKGLPDELAVPRLETPRTRVPAGSVALADGYAGIYPTASPGGWRIIGRTDVQLFDADRHPPALLSPGTRVRFVTVPCGDADAAGDSGSSASGGPRLASDLGRSGAGGSGAGGSGAGGSGAADSGPGNSRSGNSRSGGPAARASGAAGSGGAGSGGVVEFGLAEGADE